MKNLEHYLLKEAQEREFENRRSNLITDYAIQGKSALILQSVPLGELLPNGNGEALAGALQSGADSHAVSGWWNNFRSSRQAVPTFQGLASSSPEDAHGWITEMHEDGHLLAGIWTFPEVSANSQQKVSALPIFYQGFFSDFSLVAKTLYSSRNYYDQLLLTCTVLGAERLYFCGYDGRVLADPPKRTLLSWPVIGCSTMSELDAACVSMAARLFGAYGKRLPKK